MKSYYYLNDFHLHFSAMKNNQNAPDSMHAQKTIPNNRRKKKKRDKNQ